MAVNLFKITVNGTEYIYTDAATWVDSNGNSVTEPAGIAVGDEKNSDGTLNVTVDKAAFTTIGSDTKDITLEDLNAGDRQTYRLALGSGYTSNERYGARQSVSYSTSGTSTTVNITGINAGLLVSSDGTKITYETPSNTSEAVVISNLASTANNAVTVSGRTIIINASAIATEESSRHPIQILTNGTVAYSLALGAVTDGLISQKTAMGWNADTAGESAVFNSDAYTAGYYKSDDTNLLYSSSAHGGSSLFRVDGLKADTSAVELGDYFSVDTAPTAGNANVSLTASGFSALLLSDEGASSSIKITDSAGGATYRFAIGDGVNTDAHATTEGWNADTTTEYDYRSEGHSAYASKSSDDTTITIYSGLTSKEFGIGGLSVGQESNTGAVSVAKKDDGYVVTLGKNALNTQNVYVYGKDASIVSLSAAKDIEASVLADSQITDATATLEGSVLTYVAAGAASRGYDFQTNQVIYYASATASRETLTVSGLTGTGTFTVKDGIATSTLGTITPQVTGATEKTFNIALAKNALGDTLTDGSSQVEITSSTANLHYSLTLGSLSAYGKNDNPNASASSLTYDSTEKTYTYTGQYIPAYLSGTYANASVLGSNSTAVYTYKADETHDTFTLSGFDNNVFGDEASGADTNKYFTVSGKSVIFTEAGNSALLLGTEDKGTLSITDTYSMGNLTTVKTINAGFSGVVTDGAIKFNEKYETSGWKKTSDGDGTYGTKFTFTKAPNQDYAFSLSGLTGASLTGASLDYVDNTGVITVKKGSQTDITLGTLQAANDSTQRNVTLASDFFEKAGISSITLTDNDATDNVLYTFARGGLSDYGVKNMRDTEFNEDSTKGSYKYISGGLKSGYGLYLARDTAASASAGITTITKYAGSASSSFTISGLTTGIDESTKVLDYVEINSKETLDYYLTKDNENNPTTYTLKKGNYKLTANIELDYTLTIAEEKDKTGGNVAIDLGGFTLTNTSGTAFSVKGGDLIINGSGSILAQTTTSVEETTAIDVASDGNLIVNGGYIEGATNGISSAGTVLINGGTILGQTTAGNETTGTGINVTGGRLIVAGGTVTGGQDGIKMAGTQLDVTGGTVTGTTGAGVVAGGGSVNVIDGTVTGSVGLSVASATAVNVIGGSVTSKSNTGYAITNEGNTAVSIGSANIGSLSNVTKDTFQIFADYEGNTYATIGTAKQNYKNSAYSSAFNYTNTFPSVTYPTVEANSAVIVGASAGGYITLNKAALTGISTASLTGAGKYAGLALGSDVTTWDKREDPTVTEGWKITDATVAGDSSVNTATYQAKHYLESWQLGSGNKSVTRYAETGGATIELSGLKNIVAEGTSIALTDASLGSFFSVAQAGGTANSLSAVTGYTLTIANNASLLSALDGGEELTFKFTKPDSGTDKNLGASALTLKFDSSIDTKTYRTVIGSDSKTISGFSFAASVLDGQTSDKFTYRAAGTSDYYNLSVSATDTSATLKHVATDGLQTFSLSGLGDKFTSFSASAIGSNSVALIGIAGGSKVTIGTIELSGSGDVKGGLVKLNENAFTGGASQKITLTDLDMDDSVYYVLDKGTLKQANEATLEQTVKAAGSSYTYILGGSYAYYTVTQSASAINGQSSSYIQYTPQVGGQSFVITNMPAWTVAGSGNVVSIMSGDTQVGSISFSSRNVIYGGTSKASALVTLTDVAAMGTGLGSGQSVPFSFKDSDSDDSIEYTFSLGSAFNQVSEKSSNPDVKATFTAVTEYYGGGYSFAAPAYNNYTLSKGGNSYVYYAKETADTLRITGLSTGLAANDSVYAITTDYSKGASSGITTVSASGTKTGTLFTVARVKGGLSVVVYEGALQSVANREDIVVGGASLAALSLAGDLGKYGVLETAGGFSATKGGSFTYTADSFKDYYTVQVPDGVSITAKHYDGTGGQSFTFSGLSTKDFAVAGLSGAINVSSTSAMTDGAYSIDKYTFTVGSISLLKKIPQGQSLAIKVTDTTDNTTAYSLSIAENISAETDALARQGDKYVAVKDGLKPLNEDGAATFNKVKTGSGSFVYTAELKEYDWYETKGATITHKPQVGGQSFVLSGVDTVFSSQGYTYGIDGIAFRAFDSNHNGTTLGGVSFTTKGGVSVGYVYLTEDAFGSGSAITLTDMYDGTGNVVNYSLSFYNTSNDTYLEKYTGTYGSATFVPVSASTGTYNFTASGIHAGINVNKVSDSVTRAVYTGASGAEEFSISGLSAGLTVAEGDFKYDKGTTFVSSGGKSIVDVTGASSAFNVMVYSSALSKGRGDISIASGTDGVTYSLSLAKDLLLVNGAASVMNEGSGSSIAFENGSSSMLWTANTYHDYYSVTSDSFAKHYNTSGGQSFLFTVASVSKVPKTNFTGTITVFSQSGALDDDNQYDLTSVVFGVSKAALEGLNKDGDILSVASQSGVKFSGNYGFSFVGKTSDSVYGSDVIMTKSVSAAAGFASVDAGEYNFAASVGQYAWYENEEGQTRSIIYHAKVGGESFSITGMNTSLGALTYDATSGQIKSGNTLVGMVEMATLSGTSVKAANVYLTEAAFGSESKVTLTDLNSTDGISYALKLYEKEDNTYLKSDAYNQTVASFEEQTDGSYLYTASINGAYGVSSTVAAAANQKATVIEYTPQKGGQSFTITGLTGGLNASVDANSNVISNNVTIGTVSSTSDTLNTFVLKSPVALGTLAGGTTRTIELKDNNASDGIDYQLTLGSAFNYGTQATASLTAPSIQEEGEGTGTYDVQVGGISAWSEVYSKANYSYLYHAAKDATTYVVAGLRSGLASGGLSAAGLSAVFGVSTVTVNESVVPDTATTIKVLNNSAAVSLKYDDSIAEDSLQADTPGQRASTNTNYITQTYKPWTKDTDPSDGLTVYPSVGGDTFAFSSGFAGRATYKSNQIITTGGKGTIVADVTLDDTTGRINKYTFTVSGSGALATNIAEGSVISISPVDNTSLSYALDIRDAIPVGKGTPVGSASIIFDGVQHRYSGTSMSEYAEVSVVGTGGLTHAYIYHDPTASKPFYIYNLAKENLTLGTQVYIDESWDGSTLSAVNISLTGGALRSSAQDTIYASAIPDNPAVTFELVDVADSLKANVINETLSGTGGNYFYQRPGVGKGYYIEDSDKTRVRYSSSVTGGQSFVLEGLSAGLGSLSVAVGGTSLYANIGGQSVYIGTFDGSRVSIASASALGNRTVTLTDTKDDGINFELSIAGGLLEATNTGSAEKAEIELENPEYRNKLVYTAAVSAAHYTPTVISGDSSTQYVYTYSGTSKLGSDFYFDGAFASIYNRVDYDYAVQNGVITAKKSTSANAVPLASITGDTIAIDEAAFDSLSSQPFFLTYINGSSAATGYKLTLGSGMASAESREESFTESASVYSYQEAGHDKGYEVISYNGISYAGISYTSIVGGNNFDIKGIKGGMSLSIVDGNIVDSKTSATIGTYNLNANGKGYTLVLKDDAFASLGSESHSVVLSKVSNNYDTSFNINQITFSISSTLKTGEDYASNGGSFAGAVSSAGLYSITYKTNPQDAYWRDDSIDTVKGTASFTYMPTLGAADLFSIGSFSAAVTGNDFAVNNGDSLPGKGSFAVNVINNNLLPDSVNTVVKLTDSDDTDGYSFYFAAGDGQSSLVYASGSHPESIDAKFEGNVFKATSRATYTEIGSDSQTLTYIKAEGGESFSITGLAEGVNLSLSGTGVYAAINGTAQQVGTLNISGKTGVLELTNAAVLGTVEAGGKREITLTDLDTTDAIDYSLVINEGNTFYVGGNSARNDRVTAGDTAGSYTYQLGAVSTYTEKGTVNSASGIYSYVYNQATSGTEFGFTGLVGGLSGDTAAFGLDGTTFTLTDKAKPANPTAGASITFTTDSENNYYVLTNPDERVEEVANFHGNDKAVYYKEDYTDAGYVSSINGTTTTYTYENSVGGATRFTVTGLSSAFNAASMSYSVTDGNVVAGTSTTIGTYDGTTFTLNATGLSGATGTVSLGGTGNLALTGVSTAAGTTNAHWVDNAGGISYVTESNNEYWSIASADKAYTHVAKAGGDTLFGIHGLSADASSLNEGQVEAVSIKAGGYSVTVDDTFINKTAGATVSVTGSNNALYFSGNISITSAAGYASLQQGGFNGTTYSIPAYSDQMIAVNAGKNNAYYFAQGSDASYVFGISAGDFAFNTSNFASSLTSGGNSVVFTQKNGNKAQAARLDKDTKTVYVYNGIFGTGNDTTTVQLTNTDDIVIAAGDDLNTNPGSAENNNNWQGTNYLLYSAGRTSTPYFSRTNDKTLQYVTATGGDLFKLNNAPAFVTHAYLNATPNPISVSTKDGSTYTFTINNKDLLADSVLSGGLSIAVYEKFDTSASALSLAVAFAVADSLGNNEPVKEGASLTSVAGGFKYTAIGTESYYKNISSGVDMSAVASLSAVAEDPGESFTISGLTSRASLASDEISIVRGVDTLAGISFTGTQDTLTGRYKGDAYVYLTKAAFGGTDNATITVADTTNDGINYGLAYGDGSNYLAKRGDYNPETFVKTDTTYNYSASTRDQGITLNKETISATGTYTAVYSASAGYGNTFSITNLADDLTVKGGNALAGTATVGSIKDTVFTLTGLSALSAAAQDLGATTTFTLKNTGNATYSLSVADNLAVGNAKAIAETLTGASGVYTYAAAHSSAYVTKAGDNSYTFNAEAKHDQFELSGNGLAATLSLGSLSISGKTVTLLDSAINASASAGDTIVFDGDKDGDGTYYTINALPERETVKAEFAGNGTALAYNDQSTLAGWDGNGGSTATFTYSDVTGGGSLFVVTGLSAAFTGASVTYVTHNDGTVVTGTTQIGTFGASTLTLNATALSGASFVNLQGAGYSLALTGVATSASVISAAGFAVGTRTYYSAAQGAYWSGGNNSYTFNAASDSAAQFALSGTDRTADGDRKITGVSYAGGSVITINNEALSGANVTLTNLSTAIYSLSLGSNVVTSASGVDTWTQEGSKAAYVLGAVSAFYSLDNSTLIAHHDSVAGSSSVVLDGVAANASLSAPADGILSLTTADFSASGVTVQSNAGAYSFTLLDGNYNSSFTGTSSADTVNNRGANLAVNLGDGDDTVYNWSGGSNVQFDLGAGNDSVTNTAASVTIDAGAGDDYIRLLGVGLDNVSVNGGAGSNAIELTEGSNVTVNVGAGADIISVGSAITEFTVENFGTDDAIVGSFSSIETVDGGIKAGNVTIKGITGVAGTSTAWAPSGANIAYVSSSTSGATLDGGKITLVDTAGGTSTLFTIFNVNSTLGVSLDSMTVTLGQSALTGKTAGTTVSLTGAGYGLTLDSGVAQSAAVVAEAGFSGAIYSASALGEYWSGGDNAYTLNASTAGAAQFEIAGATALANSIVSGTTVNIGAANLAGASVTLTNLSSAQYALKLDSAVGGASYFNAGFTAVTSNNSASYLGAGNTAGYSQASDTQIDYISANPQATLFTLTGIANTTGIAPSAGVVTVAEANVAQNASVIAVTGTTEYTLAVTGLNTIGTPSTTYAFGTVSNNSASYIGTTTYKDFWTATDERTYTFTAGGGTSTSTVFTIDGIATIENSAVSGTTVTLGEKNFAGKNIVLNGTSYSLALDKDYTQTTTEGGFGSLVGGAATYYGEGTSDGYSLTSATQITYAKGQSGAEIFTASNITSTDNVNYAASAITVTKDASAKLTLTNLSSALTIDGFVEIAGLNATSQTVAGTPTDAKADGSNLVVTTADGAITIDGAAAATVNMAGGSAAYTAAFDRITDVTDENAKSVTLTADFTNYYYGLHQKSYGNGVTAVDATNAKPSTNTLNLTGSKQADDLNLKGASAATNSLTGGSGNDTLTGGGLDDLLKGNAGNDLFIQSAGNDTISDYTEGEDKISFASAIANTSLSGNNVLFTTTDENTVLVIDGNGKAIDIIDNNGKESTVLFLTTAPTNASVNGEDLIVTADKDYTFTGQSSATVTIMADGRTYTATQTRITDITDEAKAVTLTTDFTNYYYGLHQSYGNGVTAVDASQANPSTNTLNLTGSKQSDDLNLIGATNAANTIIGGSGNDTITGGGLGDSLKGNAGSDLFVQSAGNDTITDYTEGEDAIQLLGSETGRETVSGDVVITTAEGTILVQNGSGKEISIISGEPVIEGAPVDSNADGTDLLVTLAGDKTTTYSGQGNATVTMTAGDHNYSVAADRITDYTDASDKKVTLTGGFSGTYYGLHQSYGKGVTAVDATKAVSATTLALTGYKSTDDLELTGAPNATNNITGGSGSDTLTGGTKNDTLKGNAGADVFVQSAGNDTITDYTAGEDVISLVSAYKEGSVSGNDVILTTEDGNTIQLTGGSGQTITTTYNGTLETLVFGGDTPDVEDAPVDVTLASGNLSIELANGETVTAEGETHTMTAGGNNYSVTADRITDYTDTADKKVTLASGFSGTYYGLHQKSYANGVTAVDATKATAITTLSLTGYKQADDLTLTGAPNAANNITGGSGNDMLTGGGKDDTLKGNAGADVFVQTAGSDTITDYTAGEDIIALASEVTATAIDGENVNLTTAEGTVIVQNGADRPITTVIDGKEETAIYSNEVPTDAKAEGDNLVVTTAKGTFTMGGASDTFHVYTADKTYKVAFDRITDITTTEGRTVTLTSGFEKGYYGMHYSYAEGVTNVDATNANTTALTLTGFKSEVGIVLKGADKAANVLTGGAGNDTLTGGSGNDSLKGNAGADLFIQSGGDDVILDYAAEDTIQLTSAATATTVDADVKFSNNTGTLTVLNGSGLDIKTTIGGNANVANVDDELWGINGKKDTFLFDGGNDTIHNYEEQDAINLGGYSLSDLVSGAPSVKDSNLIFAFDKQNSFTVVDALDKNISFTDGASYSRNKK